MSWRHYRIHVIGSFPFPYWLYSRVLVYLLMLQDRLLGNSVSPVEMPWGYYSPFIYVRYDVFEALQNSCRDTTPTLLTINYKILQSTLVFIHNGVWGECG